MTPITPPPMIPSDRRTEKYVNAAHANASLELLTEAKWDLDRRWAAAFAKADAEGK